MPVTQIAGLLYGRLRSPDLDLAEQFLTDFGLVRAERTPTALYMRGTGPAHHVHVTELGEPGYVSLAWQAASHEDLARLAKMDGASGIESLDEPGGGKRVRLTDPDGRQVEVVHGIAEVSSLQVQRPASNAGIDRTERRGDLFRIPCGASHVRRLGHVAVMTENFDVTVPWYRNTLGLLCSDETYRGAHDHLVGSFNRLDRGEDYVDHHIIYFMRGTPSGLNHLAFEVPDIDDVIVGHEHLESKGHRLTWGVGRHALGSQVFDYWFDPWGRVHEHWTDSDLLNGKSPSGFGESGVYTRGPWGPYPPTNGFATHSTP
jgi:catechol 2,3-dioxygenase-like lactoylglutathione lyase family enzyme